MEQQSPAVASPSSRAKKEQLRIPVRGTNRKYYLVPPAPHRCRPDYYVRFDVPRDVRALDPLLPKTMLRSTGTNVLRAAIARGKSIIESVLEARWADAEKLKLRSCYSTLGELLEAYKPDPRTVKPLVAQKNKLALALIVREALGLTGDVSEVRLDEALSAKTLRRWIQVRQARVAHQDFVVQGKAATTLNSTLQQARSVVSPKVMELYHELRLPDLEEFRAVRRVQADADVSYKPLPQQTMNAIDTDAQLLKRGESAVAAAAGVTPDEQRQVYRAYLLMRRLGLRNSEAQFARESWIVRHGDGTADLELRRRPDFVTKNRKYRTLDISPDVLADLDEQRGLPDAWILNAPTPTERYDLAHDKLNAWLRHFIPDRPKCAYELRKHAISLIVSRPESEGGGIVSAARFAGDSIATTEKHYASYLRKIRAISPAEMRGLRVVVA